MLVPLGSVQVSSRDKIIIPGNMHIINRTHGSAWAVFLNDSFTKKMDIRDECQKKEYLVIR